MSTTYYEYVHRPGYGRDDHMADELIARAARRLGLDAGRHIAQAAGFASHPVPMGHCTVRLPVARGTKGRMRKALREARRELARNPDCVVAVVKCRVEYEYEEQWVCTRPYDELRYREAEGYYREVPVTLLAQEWRGGEWVTVSRTALDAEDGR